MSICLWWWNFMLKLKRDVTTKIISWLPRPRVWDWGCDGQTADFETKTKLFKTRTETKTPVFGLETKTVQTQPWFWDYKTKTMVLRLVTTTMLLKVTDLRIDHRLLSEAIVMSTAQRSLRTNIVSSMSLATVFQSPSHWSCSVSSLMNIWPSTSTSTTLVERHSTTYEPCGTSDHR